MKIILATLLCATLLDVPAFSQPATQGANTSMSAQRELLEPEDHWLATENDPNALESVLADDFLHVVPAGIIVLTPVTLWAKPV
ncbi:MAG: hypothetical protein KGJ79_18345 [Alphaproteobacteria bacterium]|nr:hypothetical protein [Alphaproteobacteria bacterium]MDE2495640.1 hypothetical protein [Alphaproteobacteria bacterium]